MAIATFFLYSLSFYLCTTVHLYYFHREFFLSLLLQILPYFMCRYVGKSTIALNHIFFTGMNFISAWKRQRFSFIELLDKTITTRGEWSLPQVPLQFDGVTIQNHNQGRSPEPRFRSLRLRPNLVAPDPRSDLWLWRLSIIQMMGELM